MSGLQLAASSKRLAVLGTQLVALMLLTACRRESSDPIADWLRAHPECVEAADHQTIQCLPKGAPHA